MNISKAVARPPIRMIDSEADALTDMALAAADRLPQVSALLIEEIGRATLHRAANMPADVVTMHATVDFLDAASNKTYSYQLVYPKEADIAAGRISILTPVGAGLIGLREGQSILWPDRDGRERALTVMKVVQPQEAAL